MKVALLLIGDGRDQLREDTLRSFAANCAGTQPAFVIEVDDRLHRLGFCGAILEGWARLRELGADAFDFVFHLEEDWHFEREFNLAGMIDLLYAYPALAQVALRRNAVAPAEIEAGGLVELWPDEYLDKCLFGDERALEFPWLEHGLYFTTNPCVYRRDLLERWAWPPEPDCERAFTATLLRAGQRFALWGRRADAPWITHTGRTRTGTGY